MLITAILRHRTAPDLAFPSRVAENRVTDASLKGRTCHLLMAYTNQNDRLEAWIHSPFCKQVQLDATAGFSWESAGRIRAVQSRLRLRESG